MKRMFQTLFMTALLAVSLLLGTVSVSAATPPGKVAKLKATVGETTVTLKWGRASKAGGYNIYRQDAAGRAVKLGSTTKTSYTVKNLVPGTTYKFQVCSWRRSGKNVLKSDLSPAVSCTPRIKSPGTPSKLKRSSSNSSSVTLKWNSGKNASGYELYMREGTGDFVLLGSTKNKSYTKKGLTAGRTYSFKVRSFRTYKGAKAAFSNYSNTVTVKIPGKAPASTSSSSNGIPAYDRVVHGAYYNAALRSTYTTMNYTAGAQVTIPAGTKVTATAKSGTVTCYLSNGDMVKIPASKLKFTSLKTNTRDYSVAQKEDFVNSRNYSSPSKYLIWISQYSLRVNIFKGSRGNWKLDRSWTCCVGKMSNRTPRGVFRILSRTRRYNAPALNFTPYSAKYNSQNSFHLFIDSVRQAAASKGCVRLSRENLNWMTKNCPIGTTVVSY